MAKQTLNFGTTANDGTGDGLRDGGFKIQSNFDELYAGGHFIAATNMDSNALNTAIADAQTDGATLTLPPGEYTLGGDLVTWSGTGTVGPTQGFAMVGAGKLHNFASQFGGTAMGTILRLSPGAKIQTNGARTVIFQDMALVGENDDVLFDGENAFENGGGFRRVYIENQSTAPGATVVRTGAMFTSNSDHADIVGTHGYRARFQSATPNPGLFNTVGFELSGSGKGSGGVPRGWNLHGHDIGMKLGQTAAEYAAITGAKPKIENWSLANSQISYCTKGALCGAACVSMTFIDQHWEYNADYHVKAAHGTGAVRIEGGQSNGLPRQSANQHMRDAQFVAGDADLAETVFKQLNLERHNLSYVAQAGVLVHGGSDGEVVLRDCFGNSNGGLLVALDTSNGTPHILIDNFGSTLEEGHTPFPVDRLIREVTPNTDYSRHTAGPDARWRGRIENSGIYSNNIPLNGDLDLTVQKYAPVSCTASTARTIILGDAPPVGWPTTLIKDAGTLTLVVPDGTALYHAGSLHTAADGSATITLAQNGLYELTRRDAGIWSCDGVPI
jgi:hypothetical protein